MLKEIEIVIRNESDQKKLDELKAAGWVIFERGYLMLENEPDRAFYKLSKESEIAGSIK